MATTKTDNKLFEVVRRSQEMRSICDFTVEEMAEKTEVTPPNSILSYEGGTEELTFSFIHKCALAFDIGITDLLEGHSAKLTSYTVTRKGAGQTTAKENGIEIQNLAPLFKDKLAAPYWVRHEYSADLENKPIHTTTNEVWHDGCYHTGDLAWKDEDGHFWYVGRVVDVIKSSGYRIGPFEIENSDKGY